MPSAVKQKDASGRVFVDGLVTGEIHGTVSGLVRANVDGEVNLNVISGSVAEGGAPALKEAEDHETE